MFNLYSQRGPILENERIKSQGNAYNVSRQDSLLTDPKHQGCLQRINILIQELDRMSEAQKMANIEIQYLQKEIEKIYTGRDQNNLQSMMDEYGKDEELRLQKQKFNQYKQLKEKQILDLENDLIKTHKELKEERLIRLDLNHRFELKSQEVCKLNLEIEKFQKQSNLEDENGKLNILREELVELLSQNNQLKQTNIQSQQQIQKLLEKVSLNEQKDEQLCKAKINNQLSLEDALFPSEKASPTKKQNRTLTIQQTDPYYNKSLFQSNRLSINYSQQQFHLKNNEQEQENEDENSYEHQYNSNTKKKELKNFSGDKQQTISKYYNQF